MKYTGFDLLLSGLFLALALTFPLLFHAVGLGSAFLPMFFPIVAAGFLVAPPLALLVGGLAPLVSAALTGMPPFYPPIAFLMVVEGLVLTLAPHIFHRKLKLNVVVSLALTLLLDRLVLLGLAMGVAAVMDLPQGVMGIASALRGLPGIVAMMVVVPPAVIAMKRRRNMAKIME